MTLEQALRRLLIEYNQTLQPNRRYNALSNEGPYPGALPPEEPYRPEGPYPGALPPAPYWNPNEGPYPGSLPPDTYMPPAPRYNPPSAPNPEPVYEFPIPPRRTDPGSIPPFVEPPGGFPDAPVAQPVQPSAPSNQPSNPAPAAPAPIDPKADIMGYLRGRIAQINKFYGDGNVPTWEWVGVWKELGLSEEKAKAAHKASTTRISRGSPFSDAEITSIVNTGNIPEVPIQVDVVKKPVFLDEPAAPSPAAPSTTAQPADKAPAAVQPGQYSDPNRPFLYGQHVSHLNDLIKEDPSFGLLLDRLVTGYEDRAGGKFASPIRDNFKRKGRNMAGLFDLENTADPSFIDYGTAVGDWMGAGLTEGGGVYDNPNRPKQWSGRELVTRALDKANANRAAGIAGTGLFAPDPNGRGNVRQLQRRALESAMGLDLAPTYGSTIDNTLDELESRYRGMSPQDSAAMSGTGSLIELARSLGII